MREPGWLACNRKQWPDEPPSQKEPPSDGGGGIRTLEGRIRPCWFSRPVHSPALPPLRVRANSKTTAIKQRDESRFYGATNARGLCLKCARESGRFNCGQSSANKGVERMYAIYARCDRLLGFSDVPVSRRQVVGMGLTALKQTAIKAKHL